MRKGQNVGEAAAVAAAAAGPDNHVAEELGGALPGERVPRARVLRPDLPAARAHQQDAHSAHADRQKW